VSLRPKDIPQTARPRAPSRGRPTVDVAEARIQEMLARASDMFLQQGYGHTTVAQIALATGMSKKTIYARYPTKEALFRAVVERVGQEQWACFPTISLQDDLTFEQGLRIWARELIRAATTERFQALYRLLLSDGTRFPEIERVFDGTFHEIHAPFRQYLIANLDPQRAYALLPDRINFVFAAGLNSILFHYAIGRVAVSPEQIERDTSEMVTVFLRGALGEADGGHRQTPLT